MYLIILTLPIKMSKILLLTFAFFTGIIIDIFMNTGGMHAAATVCMAFFRPYILNTMAPRDGYEIDEKPSISKLGLSWFLSYTSILVLIHHITLILFRSLSFW